MGIGEERKRDGGGKSENEKRRPRLCKRFFEASVSSGRCEAIQSILLRSLMTADLLAFGIQTNLIY